MKSGHHDRPKLQSHSSDQTVASLTDKSSVGNVQCSKDPGSPLPVKVSSGSATKQKSCENVNVRRSSDSGSDASVDHGVVSALGLIRDTLKETNIDHQR